MLKEAAPWIVIASSLFVGFIWGRLSSRRGIPEWLSFLVTPLWTGALTVVGIPFSNLFCAHRNYRALAHAIELGPIHVVQFVTGRALIWLLIGVVLGVPALFGHQFGYRRPRARKRSAAR